MKESSYVYAVNTVFIVREKEAFNLLVSVPHLAVYPEKYLCGKSAVRTDLGPCAGIQVGLIHSLDYEQDIRRKFYRRQLLHKR